MQYFYVTLFFLWVNFNAITIAHAQMSNHEQPQVNSLRAISKICLYSPFDCLQEVDKFLENTSKHSRVYYEILQYKMEALFNLQQGEALYKETKQWINNDELPLPFQITNAIYYAKSAWHVGDPEEVQASYLKAKSLLNQVNDEFPSPLRLVQFANLQMQLKEYEEAYQLMSNLLKKYPNSPDTRFMVELHGNLGHAANQMGNTQTSLKHWLDTEKWVFMFGNKQQIAVVLFNLADIYEQLNQDKEAMEYFANAINFAQQAGDKVKENQGRFRLLQIKLNEEKVCTNDALFTDINADYLPKTQHYKLSNITTRLTAC